MKIIFLSETLHPTDYQNIIRNGTFINPSKQIYFINLLNLISKKFDVIHLSKIPLNGSHGLNNGPRKYGNIHFYYPTTTTNPIIHFFRYRRLIKKFIHMKSVIFIIDAANIYLIKLFNSLSLKSRAILILFDTSMNSKNSMKISMLEKEAYLKNWKSYITRETFDDLNQLSNSASIFSIPGFAESIHSSSPHRKPYFFYSGSLNSESGLDQFITAYLRLGRHDVDLIIAGYGSDASFIEKLSMLNRSIKFLGFIEHDMIKNYQANALFNINTKSYDKNGTFSVIPTKLFEYLSSGAPTISIMHPFFFNYFPHEVEWLHENSVDEWEKRIKLCLNDDRNILIEKAQKIKNIMIKEYGIDSIRVKFMNWIEKLP